MQLSCRYLVNQGLDPLHNFYLGLDAPSLLLSLMVIRGCHSVHNYEANLGLMLVGSGWGGLVLVMSSYRSFTVITVIYRYRQVPNLTPPVPN